MKYQHFAKDETAEHLIQEIKSRLSYHELLHNFLVQLHDYYRRSFLGGKPSRFETADNPLAQPRFLIALSGGIDSTLVTYLAVHAVGKEHVLPISMPARKDDVESVQSANLVRQSLGYESCSTLPYIIDIEPIVAAHRASMNRLEARPLHLDDPNEREHIMRSGNFASRIRVGILSDLQRAMRGRILGTVNRTEYCQGYNTKFGTPISYDFGVLNELYKIDIYELAKLLDVPQAILDAVPSTGYFPGQTHAEELGATIEEQDIFCYLLFEKNLTPEEAHKEYGCSLDFANLIHKRWQVSEHKRLLNQLQEYARVANPPLPK